MKGLKKTVAVVSAIAMLGCSAGALAACGNKKGGGATKDTLVIASVGEFSEKFSPLFASSAYDQDVMDLTQIGIIGSDRVGDYILDGMGDGVNITYNGTSYNYKTPGKLEVGAYDEAADTTTYTITIRNNIKYADGTPVTIEDYLFNFYCVVDTSYTGSSTMGTLPIVGLSDYRTNGKQAEVAARMAEVDAAFAKIGKNYADVAVVYDPDPKVEDDETVQYAGGALAGSTDLAAYVTAGVITETEKGYAEDAIDYAIGSSAFAWTSDYPVDFLAGAYGINIEGMTETAAWDLVSYTIAFDELAGGAVTYPKKADIDTPADVRDYDYTRFADATFQAAFYQDYRSGIETGVTNEIASSATGDDIVATVSGVAKVSDYSMTITVEGRDNITNQGNFGTLNPMNYRYYANGWNFANNNFGFEKGNMYSVVGAGQKTRNPGQSCAGAYKFVKFENGNVYLEANEHYWDGVPSIKKIELRYVPQNEVASGINSGTIDVGDLNYSKQTVEEVKGYNSNGEVNGNKLGAIVTPFLGYGYIGLNAQNLAVDGDRAGNTSESKALRKAYATVMAAYRSFTVDSYYGDTASVIEYPISSTSWAAPVAGDQGYQEAYSKKVDGTSIYTSNMTTAQRQAAALEAAKGYFEAAGFTMSNGKFTDVPAVTAMIGGNGTGDHPTYALLDATRTALASIGVTFTISDVTNANDIWNGLDGGTVDIWVAAWGATLDPDMTQLYHSTSMGDSGTNHYAIADSELDALIVEAKELTDKATRKSKYKEAMEIVLDWAVELPVYQRSEAVAYSTERIKSSSMIQDATAYYNWQNGIDKIEFN